MLSDENDACAQPCSRDLPTLKPSLARCGASTLECQRSGLRQVLCFRSIFAPPRRFPTPSKTHALAPVGTDNHLDSPGMEHCPNGCLSPPSPGPPHRFSFQSLPAQLGLPTLVLAASPLSRTHPLSCWFPGACGGRRFRLPTVAQALVLAAPALMPVLGGNPINPHPHHGVLPPETFPTGIVCGSWGRLANLAPADAFIPISAPPPVPSQHSCLPRQSASLTPPPYPGTAAPPAPMPPSHPGSCAPEGRKS
jgi:hypothetical protein